MTPDEWFDTLATVLGPRGRVEGGVPVTLDPEERRLLLDLARIAAHRSERWAAPLSTYMAGLALAEKDPHTRVAVLAAIVADLDIEIDD